MRSGPLVRMALAASARISLWVRSFWSASYRIADSAIHMIDIIYHFTAAHPCCAASAIQRHSCSHRESRSQRIEISLPGIESDSHRHPLHDLGEVAGAGFKGQQRELRSRTWRKAL